MKLLLTTLLAAGLLALPAAASARDRDQDGMGDRWERRHHVQRPAGDPDRDGLRNRREFELRTDPRDADSDDDGLRDRAEVRSHNDPRDDDSDDDGIEDGDEQAGTIASFTDGVLTIALFDGSQVSGLVTDATEIECEDEGDDDAPIASTSRGGGDDDDSGSRSGDDDDRSGPGDGDDDGEREVEHEDDCASTELTAGRRVHEAELDATSAGAVWHEVELLP